MPPRVIRLEPQVAMADRKQVRYSTPRTGIGCDSLKCPLTPRHQTTMEKKIMYIRLVTRSGDHVLDGLHTGTLEQLLAAPREEIESSLGNSEERVFGHRRELIGPPALPKLRREEK